LIKRSLHIILAISVLLSSTGLVISKHFCQNELIDVAFYAKATSCHPETNQELPTSNENDSIQLNDCCKDVSNHLKVEPEQQASPQFNPIDPISDTYLPAINAVQYVSICYIHQLERYRYKPPLLVYDIPVNLQVFLC
jgi:hypothetical protein